MKAILPLLSVLVLAACASTQPGPTERRVAFSCENSQNINVVFSGNTARIETAGAAPIVLQQRVSGSGFWYESPTHSIRGKGDEITYTVGRMVPTTCTAIGPQAR